MSLEFPKVDLSGVNEAMGNLNASLEKFAEDIQKRKDNAMAMEFTRVICDLLKENGVTVEMTEIEEENHATNKFEVKYGFAFTGLDFSEHDKKVAEEKDEQIRELRQWCEVLETIIGDGKKPGISVSENGVSVGCECGGYHLAKERIAELERDLKECKDEVIAVRKNRDEMMEGFRNGIKPYVDLGQMHETIAELRDRHQSDCIEINRLNVALEVMTEKYMKLREVHGL